MSRSTNNMVVGKGGKEDDTSQSILDFSSKELTKMSNLPNGLPVSKLILDHNKITKIENLEDFPVLSSLSIADNQLLRMNGVNFGKNLTRLNLSNNGIVLMEDLCWLVHLENLDLSKNNIKRIQNVSYCTKLQSMDLSENSIEDISDLSSLVDLKVLLLHGNAVSSLQSAEVNLPAQLETLSLAGNHISDLNEVHHLSSLQKMKHFSLLNNPCVISTPSIPGFDYRPFLLFCCPMLMLLDGFVVKDLERNNGEMLRSDENLQLFTYGHHLQLILYLSKVSPAATVQQLNDEQNKFLETFLETQKSQTFTEKVDGNDITPGNGDLGIEGENSDEDDVNDLLRSESSFLPVYSPLKKSLEINDRDYQSSFDSSLMWDDQKSCEPEKQEFPIMTEEEANKLIHLAATILQANIRGFLVRRKLDYKNFKRTHNAACKIQALWKGYYFRHVSDEGKRFKQELRVRRLQKYVSTLCIMMQKSEEQHEFEKQQLLEAVTILYEKFNQLSNMVEEQNIMNKTEQYRLRRNAAVVLQKHWRGYMVRKLFPRVKSNNPLTSLVDSHIELTKKVKYLESLLIENKLSDAQNSTEVDAVFLPHPRHLETKQQVEEMEKLIDVDEWNNRLDKNDRNIEDHKVTLVEGSNEQEIVDESSLDGEDNVEDRGWFIKENDEDKNSSAVEMGVLENSKEYGGTDMDSKGLLVDSVEDGTREFAGENSMENVENLESSGKDVREDSQRLLDSKDHDSSQSGQQLVFQITEEESQGQLETSGVHKGDNTFSKEQSEIGMDDILDTTILESKDTIPAPSSEGDSEVIAAINDGTKEDTEDNLDNLGTAVEAGGLGSGNSDVIQVNVGTVKGTVEPVDSLDISVKSRGTDERIDDCDDEKGDTGGDFVEPVSEHEVQDIPLEPTTELEQESTLDVEIPHPVRRTSGEITMDADISQEVERCKPDSTNGEESDQNGDSKRQGNISDHTTTDIKVSPRLGKRASSLLSALKNELTNVSPRTSDGEETAQHAASHTSSEDQELSPDVAAQESSPQTTRTDAGPGERSPQTTTHTSNVSHEISFQTTTHVSNEKDPPQTTSHVSKVGQEISPQTTWPTLAGTHQNSSQCTTNGAVGDQQSPPQETLRGVDEDQANSIQTTSHRSVGTEQNSLNTSSHTTDEDQATSLDISLVPEPALLVGVGTRLTHASNVDDEISTQISS